MHELLGAVETASFGEREILAVDPEGASLTNVNTPEDLAAVEAILSGAESEITVASFFVALRAKGVTVDELMGFASAARERATLPCKDVSGLVCLCSPNDGTENVPPLDVAAGLIAAGAGARVLILSDRNVPPRRGLTAADVLDALKRQPSIPLRLAIAAHPNADEATLATLCCDIEGGIRARAAANPHCPPELLGILVAAGSTLSHHERSSDKTGRGISISISAGVCRY